MQIFLFAVDGGWSDFEPETSCSVTCGVGVQCFARNCSSPVPACGGKMCDGPMMEQRSCDLGPCAVLRMYSVWFNILYCRLIWWVEFLRIGFVADCITYYTRCSC